VEHGYFKKGTAPKWIMSEDYDRLVKDLAKIDGDYVLHSIHPFPGGRWYAFYSMAPKVELPAPAPEQAPADPVAPAVLGPAPEQAQEPAANAVEPAPVEDPAQAAPAPEAAPKVRNSNQGRKNGRSS
jgi:hypothetical protein